MKTPQKTSGPTQIGLQDLLRAGHVKRWHIVQTAREQTLAEHNYMVATIALSLYNDVTPEGAGDVGTAVLLAEALFHDAPEVRTGDIPTPGKRLIKHFAGDCIFDKVEKHINGHLPLFGTPHVMPGSVVDLCVKLADHIEAAVWIRECSIGKRAEEVAEKCWLDMENFVEMLHTGTDADWRKATNKVLSAMLAPNLRSHLS